METRTKTRESRCLLINRFPKVLTIPNVKIHYRAVVIKKSMVLLYYK